MMHVCTTSCNTSRTDTEHLSKLHLHDFERIWVSFSLGGSAGVAESRCLLCLSPSPLPDANGKNFPLSFRVKKTISKLIVGDFFLELLVPPLLKLQKVDSRCPLPLLMFSNRSLFVLCSRDGTGIQPYKPPLSICQYSTCVSSAGSSSSVWILKSAACRLLELAASGVDFIDCSPVVISLDSCGFDASLGINLLVVHTQDLLVGGALRTVYVDPHFNTHSQDLVLRVGGKVLAGGSMVIRFQIWARSRISDGSVSRFRHCLCVFSAWGFCFWDVDLVLVFRGWIYVSRFSEFWLCIGAKVDLLHELFLIEVECGVSLLEWRSATGSQWLGCARLTGQELSTGVVFLYGSSCAVLSSSFGGVWRLRRSFQPEGVLSGGAYFLCGGAESLSVLQRLPLDRQGCGTRPSLYPESPICIGPRSLLIVHPWRSGDGFEDGPFSVARVNKVCFNLVILMGKT
ncbi:hypothetical protein F2Q70_00020491 [Brassica cretica]|uniref:Uncharacterized protein n=1 Tax=Brassica cretica TaxID=69181 RepID=A0A8S9GNU4_BRACR|nr:hypothetical protein F2Q70_00020491 [Brassica cretica]